MKLLVDDLETPLGTLAIVSDGASLCALDYRGFDDRMMGFLRNRFDDGVEFTEADDPQGFTSAIRAYLAGDLRSIEGLAVKPGGTPFQQRVWAALREIPPGTTKTYGQLAAELGNPAASRAVGLANSLNPVAIVVPCHRVIGSNGKLTGYAGGLDRKQWLLRHEGALPEAAVEPQMALSFAQDRPE